MDGMPGLGSLVGMQEAPPQCTRPRLVGCADSPGWAGDSPNHLALGGFLDNFILHLELE